MPDFLTLKPEAFGLDISDSSLKIAKLEKKGKSLQLVSFGRTEIPAGIVEGGEIKNEEVLAGVIQKAIGNVAGKKIATKYVVASLPEEKSFLQVIQLPRMKDEEELKQAIYFEPENYIPLPADEVYIDFQIIPPISDHLDHFDVLIVALPKKTVDPYILTLKKAGLKIKALEIESLAITRALVKNGVSPHPLLLVDLGENRTSFMIFSGYSLRFTNVLSISGKQFTQIIADAFGISFQEAEELKLTYGLSEKYQIKIKNHIKKETSPGKVFEVLLPYLRDLAQQIRKYFDYYQTHISHEHLAPGGKIVEKILLCGGGANLKGIAPFFSLEFKIPTEISNPWINIFQEPFSQVPELPFEKSLSFTIALGLALKGMAE